MPDGLFTDARQREWRLELNFALAKRLRDVTGLDFVNYHDGKALLSIHESDEKLEQVLWLLCAKSEDELGVDEEAFGRGLGGEALEQALAALEEALVSFSRPARRQAIQAIRDKAHELVAAQQNLAETKIRSLKFQKALEKKLASLSDEIDRRIEAEVSTPGSLVATTRRSPA